MSKGREERQLLVDRYVSSFEKLADLEFYKDLNPIAGQLATGEEDGFGCYRWKPVRAPLSVSALERIYASLPGRFPPLFEILLLSYRWAEVDLGQYRLIPNPPGLDLSGFLAQMSKDRGICEFLKPAGYLQFGKGPDNDYDPVCFDIRSRKKNRDCRVIKVDHEEILCNRRVKIVSELAPSFEQLMLRTIEQVGRA